MAANPWSVVSVTPTASAPPASAQQPAGAGDPWAIQSVTPAQPSQPAQQPQQSFGQRLMSELSGNSSTTPGGPSSDPMADATVEALKGVGKGALRSVSGVVQAVHSGLEQVHPGLGEKVAPQADIDEVNRATQTHNGNQEVGNALETLYEWFGGEKLLTQGVEAVPQLTKVMGAMKKYEEASPAVQRVILKAAQSAAKQGTIGAAQGVEKTGTLEGGKQEGEMSALLGAAAEPIAAGAGKLQQYGKSVLEALRPDTESIAGVDVPRMASQRPTPHNQPEPPVQADATPGNTPKYAKAQQVAARQVEQNIAQDAGARSVANTNRIRMQVEPLKAQPGAPDVDTEFHIPSEAPQPAGSSGANTVQPNATVTGQRPALTAGRPQLGSGKPSVTIDATPQLGDGSAPLVHVSHDPAEAMQALSALDERAEDGALSPQMEDARKNLADQVRMHYAQLSGPNHFYQLDPQEAMRGVRTYREAADRLSYIHQPTWDALDQASNGEFSQLRRAEKQAIRTIRTSPDQGAIDQAQIKLKNVQASMDKVFTDNAGTVSRAEWTSAKQGYTDELLMRKVAAMTDRATNGVTLNDEAASGGSLRKDYKGLSAKTVQSLVDADPRVTQMLGADGVLNIKKMGTLLQEPKLREDASKLSYLIGGHMAGHWIRGGAGALIGGATAEAQGKPVVEGIAAGAAGGVASRMVLRRLMTNPEAGRLFRYAVENKVNPKVAVPLVAGTLAPALSGQQANPGGHE